MYRKSAIWWAIYSDGYTLTATVRNSMHMFHTCELRRVYCIQWIEKQSYCMQMNKKVEIYLADLCRKSFLGRGLKLWTTWRKNLWSTFFIYIVKIHTGSKKCYWIPLSLAIGVLQCSFQTIHTYSLFICSLYICSGPSLLPIALTFCSQIPRLLYPYDY